MSRQEAKQQERIVNGELARLLRERCNLDAQAETIVDGRQPDILIERSNGPVIIETEFAPAYSVNDDALAKLGLEYRGEPAGITFAVTIPAELKATHQQHLQDRLAAATLKWQPWRSAYETGLPSTGNFIELSEDVARAETRTDDLEQAVERLAQGAQTAGSRLYSKLGSMARVALVFERDISDEVANMAALMVINAMVFHDRLASASGAITPPLLRIS